MTTTMKLQFPENPPPVVIQAGNPAPQLEPLEWFNDEARAEWQQYWRSLRPDQFEFYLDVFKRLEAEFNADPESLLRRITGGAKIQRNEKCGKHGMFTRPGYRFGNWIAWAGHDNVYGANWRSAGCAGCLKNWQELTEKERKRRFDSLPVREFDLRTPVACGIHGNFLVWATFAEYSEGFEKVVGHRYRLEFARHNTGCPGCDDDVNWEWTVQNAMENVLPEGGWELVGGRILALIDEAHVAVERAETKLV